MIMIIAVILWVLLALVQTMRFRAENTLSKYEFNRRVGQGDPEAVKQKELMTHQPLLESLRTVVVTLIGVTFVTVLVTGFGVFSGVLTGAVGLLLSPLLQRVPILCRLADRLVVVSRPYALKAAEVLAPALRWLRDRELASGDARIYSPEELIDLVERSPGVLTRDQAARLSASLAFDTKLVRDVMTPRTVIDTADVRDNVGPLVLDDLHKTGHSRFPVIDGDIDHIVGMLYLHDLIDLKAGHNTVKAAMNPKVYYIHEEKDLSHALHAFLKTHHHLFVVVNDYRETVGLLSLEDVLESLVGKKIIDEFDQFDDLRAVAASNPRKNNTHTKAHDI